MVEIVEIVMVVVLYFSGSCGRDSHGGNVGSGCGGSGSYDSGGCCENWWGCWLRE